MNPKCYKRSKQVANDLVVYVPFITWFLVYTLVQGRHVSLLCSHFS